MNLFNAISIAIVLFATIPFILISIPVFLYYGFDVESKEKETISAYDCGGVKHE